MKFIPHISFGVVVLLVAAYFAGAHFGKFWQSNS